MTGEYSRIKKTKPTKQTEPTEPTEPTGKTEQTELKGGKIKITDVYPKIVEPPNKSKKFIADATFYFIAIYYSDKINDKKYFTDQMITNYLLWTKNQYNDNGINKSIQLSSDHQKKINEINENKKEIMGYANPFTLNNNLANSMFYKTEQKKKTHEHYEIKNYDYKFKNRFDHYKDLLLKEKNIDIARKAPEYIVYLGDNLADIYIINVWIKQMKLPHNS